MKKAFNIIFFVSFFIAGSDLFAQQGSNYQDNQGSVESLIILKLSESTERAHQLHALELLEKKSEEEALDSSANYISALTNLITYGFSYNVRGSIRRREIDFPSIRSRAIRVFALLGGDAAKETMKQVTSYETNPTVLAEAVYAIGDLGDPNDVKIVDSLIRVYAFNSFVAQEINKNGTDNNLAYAWLLALERLASKGAFTKPDNIRIAEALLNILSAGDDAIVGAVKNKAYELIDKLKES